MLGCRRLDADGDAIDPGNIRLTVTAPALAGRMAQIVDLVEEGSFWFGSRHPEGVARAVLDVAEVEADTANP